MKKLLTLLVSVATAFYAMASETAFTQSGTSFEGISYADGASSAAFNVALDDNGTDIGNKYWFTSATDDYGIITNYDGTATTSTPIASRPGQWADNDNQKYLLLDTANDALFRTVHPVTATETNAQEIGTGLYIDTLVQFTAAEDAPQVETGVDKLAVWLQATEAVTETTTDEGGVETTTVITPASTNLVITAGYYGTDGEVVPKHYTVNNFTVEAGTWHRLTIKSISSICSTANDTTVGFVVYVDETALSSTDARSAEEVTTDWDSLNNGVKDYADNNQLFVSMVGKTALAAQTITAVGFKGSGAVDDISFTTEAPEFASGSTIFTLNWDSTVASLKWSLDNTTWTAVSDLTALSTAIPMVGGATTVYVDVEYTDPEFDDEKWLSTEATIGTDCFVLAEEAVNPSGTITGTKVLFMIGETGYRTFDDLISNLPVDGSEFTIKLNSNVSIKQALSINGHNAILDLAGKTLTSSANYAIMVQGGSLRIIDSSDGKTGTVTALRYSVAINDGYLYIDAGTFGANIAALGGTLSISQGKLTGIISYDEDNNPAETAVSEFVAEGSTCSEAVDADGYWVVTAAGGGDDPVVTYVASIGEEQYETLEAAIAAATSGATVTLLTNLDVTQPIEIDTEFAFAIDLGGHKLTATGSSAFFVKAGQPTIKNGTIDATGVGVWICEKTASSADAAFDFETNPNGKANVTLESTLTVDANENAVLMYNGAVLNTDAILRSDSTEYATIQGSGSYATNPNNVTKINITGGSVTNTGDHAIYHPQPGTLTITGGTISGVTGIEMRAGRLNMSAGTVTATGTYDTEANSNGSTVDGAAVVLSQHVTGENVTANITGGSITAGADGKTLVVANTTGADPVSVTAEIDADVIFDASNAVVLIDTLKLEGNETDGYSVVALNTYVLTLPNVTGATATVTVGEETITDYTAIAHGTVVTVTWTAAAGYTITAGATQDITMTANTTAATPTVEAISGGYPTYIDPTNADAKAKYDAWSTAYSVTDTGSAYGEAFLLNVAPADVEDAKAAFKITAFSIDASGNVTYTTTTEYTTGKTYNGKVTIKRYSDVQCTTESDTGTFFKAVLQ